MRVRIAKQRWFDIEPGQRWANRYNKRVVEVRDIHPDEDGNEFNTRVTTMEAKPRGKDVWYKTGNMYAHTLVRNWVLLPSEQ